MLLEVTEFKVLVTRVDRDVGLLSKLVGLVVGLSVEVAVDIGSFVDDELRVKVMNELVPTLVEVTIDVGLEIGSEVLDVCSRNVDVELLVGSESVADMVEP